MALGINAVHPPRVARAPPRPGEAHNEPARNAAPRHREADHRDPDTAPCCRARPQQHSPPRRPDRDISCSTTSPAFPREAHQRDALGPPGLDGAQIGRLLQRRQAPDPRRPPAATPVDPFQHALQPPPQPANRQPRRHARHLQSPASKRESREGETMPRRHLHWARAASPAPPPAAAMQGRDGRCP
nr:uncharacterized protein LOC127315652 [Lolium perenne]